MNNTLQLREVRLSDKSSLLKLCNERPYPDSLFMEKEPMRETVAGNLEQFFQSEAAPQELTIRVLEEDGQVCGFIILDVNDQESITKQAQTLICDYHVKSWEQFEYLFQWAAETARDAGGEYLVVSNYSRGGEQNQAWLEKLGFQPELLRVARYIEAGQTGAAHPDYRVRKATDNDMLFIMRLVANNSPIYCPAGREVDRELIQAGFVSAYTSIGPRNKKRVPLILEERATGEPLGYIIVDPGKVIGATKTVTLYIYDIAVAPEAPTRGLSRYLCGGGETLLGRMGGGVFFGDISADNQLAVGAQKGLGFEVDSIRWGLKLQ